MTTTDFRKLKACEIGVEIEENWSEQKSCRTEETGILTTTENKTIISFNS